MIIMKFGGTSVQDAASIRKVCDLISSQSNRRPLVVVSACAGVTNALIEIAQTAAAGPAENALRMLRTVRNRHKTIADELFASESPGIHSTIVRYASEVESLVCEAAHSRRLDPRIQDAIVSYGELWSSALLAEALRERHERVDLVDARSVVVTDDRSPAKPMTDLLTANASSILLPKLRSGCVVVTQGFIGSASDGKTTTLGRGGSDYSASLLGAALGAEEIQIWTDVDGILTADPSIVPQARQIKEMTFQEAAELAYFGARVLHPATILPAIIKNIPVRVLNSKKSGEGTLIRNLEGGSRNGVVKSIAYKEGITTLTLHSTRKLMNYGFLARVFAVFEKYKKNIDVVATSEVGVSLTVDNSSHLQEIIDELSELADVRVESHKAVLCVVGEKIKYTKGIAGSVFKTLSDADINIELISHGGSEINLTFVIAEEQIGTAVRALHEEFFEEVRREEKSGRKEDEVQGFRSHDRRIQDH